VTSRSGSSQVLEALGVKLEVTDPVLTDCLEQAGMCFCFAPAHHRAMKHVASVRQSLGFRTLFNILGPLANPAGATRQVVGVYSPDLTEPLAQVLLGLGAQQAMVVHGLASQIGGLDELTAVGVNRISHLCQGQVRTFEIDGQSLGFAASDLGPILVQSPQASARVIRGVLAGRPGPARDVVCLNAAAVLLVAGVAADLAQGVALAAQAIDGQEAADVLAKLVRITQSH